MKISELVELLTYNLLIYRQFEICNSKVHFFVKKTRNARIFGALREDKNIFNLENLQTVEQLFFGNIDCKISTFSWSSLFSPSVRKVRSAHSVLAAP